MALPVNRTSSENMQVAVRLRPMTNREREKGNKRIVEIEQNTVQLMNPKYTHDRYKKFTFDYSYWSYDGFKRNQEGVCVPDSQHPNGTMYVDQERVFRDLGQFLLDNAISGYHSALLAYGQTGSGKSYTVSGYGPNEGILPRFARAIFQELDKSTVKHKSPGRNATSSSTTAIHDNDNHKNTKTLNQRYEVYFSMIEIYNEVVRDLLANGAQHQQQHPNSAGDNSLGGQDNGDSVPPATPVRVIPSSSNASTRGLKIREHPVQGFFVENLSSFICNNKNEILALIEEGQLNKSIAATRMNETSSRGHTIYEFRIKQYKLKGKQSDNNNNSNSNSKSGPAQSASSIGSSTSSSLHEDEIVVTSVVQLVDLAGSERTAIHMPEEIQPGLVSAIQQGGSSSRHTDRSSSNSIRSNTNQVGGSSTLTRSSNKSSSIRNSDNQQQTRFKESVSINQSLSALGNCIQVMSQNSQQQASLSGSLRSVKIPYRDSALTKLLNRCCLSGNSKVVIIATLSPADTHFEETLSTLRFADRAKQIRTHAVINQTSRRASLADGGALGSLKDLQAGKTRGKLRQINESENSSNELESSAATGANPPATPRRGSRNTNNKTVVVRKGPGGKSNATNSKTNLASSSSNPSLARAANANNASDNSNKSRNNRAPQKGNDNKVSSQDIRKSRSEHALAAAAGAAAGPTDAQTSRYNEDELNGDEDEDFINDLIDIRDGFISPESDDSMAALADEDLSTSEKIEILNRMINNSGPSERILAIQEENEPSLPIDQYTAQAMPNNKGAATTTTARKSMRNNKLRDEIKQVSLISSTLKKTNPYITNLNADEQLSGVLSFMIKEGETIIGKAGKCDVVIHGTEIRGQHAKITRSSSPNDPIYLECIMPKQGSGANGEPKAADPSVNIRVNGQPVVHRVELHHCDRILFGTNSYFVFANLRDKNTSQEDKNERSTSSQETHQIADLDLITYEMARNEVLRGVMHEDQNKSVIKEIKGYTHRPGTGKFKKPEASEQQQATSESQKQSQVAFSSNQSMQARTQSRDTIHKLTRSLTIKDSSQTEAESSEPEASDNNKTDKKEEITSSDNNEIISKKTTSRVMSENNEQSIRKENNNTNEDEIYRKQLLEDTYDYVIPVTEANAIATEMGIKVHYELKIVNGEEQLAHQLDRNAFNQNYYDSNTSDGFSSSSVGEETINEQRNQSRRSIDPTSSFNSQSMTSPSGSATFTTHNTTRNSTSNHQSASSTGGASDIPTSASSMQKQQAQRDMNHEKEGSKDSVKQQQQRVTYLSELQDLDILPELYIRVYLEEFDISFYWHKEKFQARRYKMLELYGPWSLGGKTALVEYLMEQSRIQGNYLIDPFIDDPHTSLVLIGHAQITLQPIPHQTDKRQSYDIVNINDELVGTINVEAIPCYANTQTASGGGGDGAAQLLFEPFSDEDLATHILEDSRQLLGEKLAFMLRIVSCSDLPAKFSNIFCQYSFGRSATSARNKIIRTRVFYHDELELSESGDKFSHLEFNHSHFICFDCVTEDILDFLEFGFLTIQIVGQHLIPKQLIGQSPTMITTIIRSINKFRSKLEQASSANDSNGGDYYLESANSSTNTTSGDNNKQIQSGPNANKAAATAAAASSGSTSMSNSAKTINMYEQNNGDFDENGMPLNGASQDNLVDMILTKRKLDRAEDKLHLIKRTVNMAEQYNRKHIPIKVVKKLLNSYGQEVIQTSIEEVASNNNDNEETAQVAKQKKHCIIQ